MPSSDQILFNSHDLSSLVMCRMERSVMPPVKITTKSVPGKHGEHLGNVELEGYDIPVTIWLRSEDRRNVATIRHQLAALLWSKEAAPLVLPDDPDIYHLAIVSGDTDLGAITSDIPKTTITFHVCDPIGYGTAHTDSLVAGTAKALDSGGTWPSYPVVTSVLSGGTWRITNQETSEYVEVNDETFGTELLEDATLVCDMATERVTINGNDAGVELTSLFFTLEGETSLLVTGAKSTTVDWRERWL